uniref:Uncharacterized protein n=1 Tax=Rhizophora mucronata TaxID=61149 RepID=A0A2P2Q6Q4_RHIMU
MLKSIVETMTSSPKVRNRYVDMRKFCPMCLHFHLLHQIEIPPGGTQLQCNAQKI